MCFTLGPTGVLRQQTQHLVHRVVGAFEGAVWIAADQCAVKADGAAITERFGKSKNRIIVEFSCVERLEGGDATPAERTTGSADLLLTFRTS
jgi:hypothetical protein